MHLMQLSEDQLINDNAYFFHMIVVRNGQVFKYSQKVFKYRRQYLGTYILI